MEVRINLGGTKKTMIGSPFFDYKNGMNLEARECHGLNLPYAFAKNKKM